LVIYQDGGRFGPRLESPSEEEVAGRSLSSTDREVVGSLPRHALDHSGQDAQLDQAVTEAKDLARWRLPARGLGAGTPRRAPPGREIEVVSRDKRLDRDDQADHAEQAPRDRPARCPRERCGHSLTNSESRDVGGAARPQNWK